MRPLTQGRRLAKVLGATLVAGGLVVSAAGFAAADVVANHPGPSGVVVSTNFDLYPQVPIPDGCNAGAGFLVGASYSATRGALGQAAGATNTSGGTMQALGRLFPGDTLTMQWTGFAGECDGEAVGVSLAVKSANSPSFDPVDNQALLLDFAYCGVGGTSCGEANNTLSIVMPDYGVAADDEACAYQIDAVIGGPLEVVGPNGSFYNDVTRADNNKNPNGGDRLISANNGGPEACADVTKLVVVGEGAPNPGVLDYVICLTPLGEGATVNGQDFDNLVCPEGAIEVVVRDGQSARVEVVPGTTYDINELFGDNAEFVGQLVPTAGLNDIEVTNLYDCADRVEQPQDEVLFASLAGTVIIDVDCTPVTTTTTTPTTTPTTAPPCVNCRNEETTTTTVAATTTAAATTVATTIPDRSATPPPDEEVAGTTVQPAEELPVTGNGTWPAARLGILMVLSGAAALALSKRRRAEA